MQHTTTTPGGLLHQIATIQRMEPGKLCIIGHGKDGPFYNLQCREQGKPVSRYVPQDQVAAVAQNTANYRTFQTLVDQYAQAVIAQTRAERLGGQKKAGGLSPTPGRRAPAVDGSVSGERGYGTGGTAHRGANPDGALP